MRILFIYPDIGSFLPRHYQHGLGYLSAVLKQAGHQTSLIYLSQFPSREELRERVREFAPELIAYSFSSHQFPYIRQISRWLKEDFPQILSIAGGVHASLSPEEVIAEPGIDLICRGEGEQALLELVEALEEDRSYLEIENLWAKWKGRVVKNPLRELIENLDQLPFPDREVFEYQEILDEDNQRLSLLVGRGCPFNCTYCANQGRKQLYQGKGSYVRLRSVEHLLQEISECEKKYRFRSLDFNDDIFTLNRAWLEEFYEKYSRRFNYPFRINVHIGTVDKEIFQKLKELGCEMARVGVESGSERVRREIMNRKIKSEQILKAFSQAEEAGIKTWSFNMVGLPGEGAEDALATYNLNRRLCPDHMQVSVFNPYPGTVLYQLCKEKGYLKGEIQDGYFVPESALEFPSLSRSEIHNWHQRLVRLGEVCRNQKQLKRALQGRELLFDLIDLLPQAEIITPVPDYYGEEYVMIYEQTRRVLIMHPPCRVRFFLELPEPAELHFGIMMHPGIYQKGESGGVLFLVRAGKKPEDLEEIFSHHLDAKVRAEDRGFFDEQVSLERFGRGKLILELETRAKIPEKNQFNTAGFTNPIIVSKITEKSGAKDCSARRA